MNILLVNNFYYNRGGDCTYLFSLKSLLESRGHKVIIFSMHHPLNYDSPYSDYFVSYINYEEEIKTKSVASAVKVAKRTIYSIEARKKIEQIIKHEKPDIAHIQNIHHHITPSIFGVLKKHKIPIIWTLHDYSLLCPNTSFLAHGKICEKCKNNKYFWAPILKCKKNSLAASSMAMIETSVHRIFKSFHSIDLFIAPSQFLKNKLIEYGYPQDKIACLNNFSFTSDTGDKEQNGNYYLYVGRISEEKGVKTLIDAAAKVHLNNKSGETSKTKLKIVGDGPLKEKMVSYAREKTKNFDIEFLGYKSHEEVLSLLRKCRFVVLPSEWYENFPYSILEAFSYGKPAIGSRLGGIPETIKNWQTGLLFEAGDSEELSLKIEFYLNHPDKAEEMGENAEMFIKHKLMPAEHYMELIDIYKKLLARGKA